MNPITRSGRRNSLVGTAIVLAISLCLSGGAWAMYLPDGTKPDGFGGNINPGDGMCVVGVANDGTMRIDASITNARDCVAYTTGLTGMTSSSACATAGAAGNDGYKHTWATSNTCVNAANPTVAIPLTDLDRTLAMCQSKGGTTLTSPGTCVAYGWVYMNRKADGTLPVTGAGVFTTHGVQLTDNLGFCYATMDMTTATNNAAATCPSYHNTSTLAGALEWPACSSSTSGCQTPASYDAGLGWAFTSNQCRYSYGQIGPLASTATRVNGTTTAAGTVVDTTGITKQGGCLAAGYTWENWFPNINRTTKTNVDAGYETLPAGALVVKLDALTSVAAGGGNFISGTGSICTKCHTDQSRAYSERDKPGYVETRHKLAGDNPGPWTSNFTATGSDWGLRGVQCNVCHSTAKPAQDDLIQVVPAGLATAGNPKSATGHNQTEEGSHVTEVCFHCHGTAATPTTDNPASAIPVFGGDFALTAKGLAPIANEFLNSPHAEYGGGTATPTSLKQDIGRTDNYGSPFVGFVCRSSNSVGGGSALSTNYRSGVAGKIPYLDSLTNPACTNTGDGSAASGAATSPGVGAFWVKEGEAVSGGTPGDTAQGNCTTCHDVHWAMGSANPEAEPFKRECTTCHQNPGTSATNAPQINLATINHLFGTGTPLENWASDPNEACEVCHMPPSSADGSLMHLWRISTDANYTTMGATQANLAADGDYAGAAWVDLDHACGQCHGGNGAPKAGMPYYTTAQLAAVARGMHASSGKNYPTTFNTTIDPADAPGNPIRTTLRVKVVATVDCGGCGPLTYDWYWGDNTSIGPGNPSYHLYGAPGTYTITLIAKDNGLQVGTATRNVTVVAPDWPPIAAATCTWNADTWTMGIQDASTDESLVNLQVIVDWGDGGAKSNIGSGGIASKTYTSVGAFNVTLKAIDSKLQSSVYSCPAPNQANPAYFSIAGTVYASDHSTPVGGARVTLLKNGATQAYTMTAADGTYTFENRRPGTYSINVSRSGFQFTTPAIPSVIVGPSLTGQDVNAMPNSTFGKSTLKALSGRR